MTERYSFSLTTFRYLTKSTAPSPSSLPNSGVQFAAKFPLRVRGTRLLEHKSHLIFLPLSPSGKLVQIEYALQAVAAGAPSVGIKGNI